MKKITPTIIKLFFILTISVLIYSCDKDSHHYNSNRIIYDQDSHSPLVTFLVDENNFVNMQFNNEIRKTINYTKIPYKQIGIKSLNKTGKIPETTKVLIIQESKSLNKKSMAAIINYVASGNTVYFPNINTSKNFGFLAGIKRNIQPSTNIEAQGFYFKKTLIPDFKDRPFENGYKHFGYNRKNYKEDIEIWATAANDTTYPTIIKNKIGNGQVITMNTTMVSSKKNRGLLFGGILAGLELVPYPIANVSSIFLDDFPAPLYKVIKKPINDELKMNQAEFYVKKWWPDLLKLANKYDIKYTTVACFDYRNNTTPPFLFSEWESLKPSYSPHNFSIPDILMNQIIENDHESGLHGYNHQSLIKKDWPNPDFMEASLISANKRWLSLDYGKLPVSYVPPSNHIDSLGIAAIEKGTPSIKYMASLYFGDFENGGNREYDEEPYSYYLFDFPRITSGYVLNQESQFDQQSLYLYTGIWSHFVHPDDVYQIPHKENQKSKGEFKYRNSNNYGWEKSKDGSPGMLPRFENYIKKMKHLFPFIRFLTTENASEITKSWRYATYKYALNENEIIVNSNNSDKNAFWFMYVTFKNSQAIETNLKKQHIKFSKTHLLNGYLYNINTTESNFTSKLFNHKAVIDPIVHQSILNDYKSYSSKIKSFDSIEEEVLYLVAEDQLEKAIHLLQEKIKANKTFSKKDWLDLYKYSGWTGQQYLFWSFLDLNYLQTQSKDYIVLSRLLTKKEDFPNLEIKKKWLKRQFKFFPNDAVLKSEYNKYFIINNDINVSTDHIIYSIETSYNTEENSNLFELLLSRDQSKAEQFLKTKTPCEDDFLIAIADRIAWLYADKENYKAALKWSNCTTKIKEENLIYWKKSAGEFKFLKESNYPEYIEYLLVNHPKKLAQELINIEPCHQSELKHLSDDIAYAYGNIGAYRKALNWAKCNEKFPVKDKLYWHLELRNYSILEKIYFNYKKKHPEDNSLDDVMVDVYLTQEKYKEAFYLFTTLSPSRERNKLQKLLNKNASYISNDKLSFLLKNYSTVFYTDVKDKLEKRLRLNNGNTLEYKSDVFSDRLRPTYINNELLYSFLNKKNNRHFIGITQSKAYEVPIEFIDNNNIDHSLFGVSYNFNLKNKTEKIAYNFGGKLELNEKEDIFFHIKSGISLTKKHSYSSLELSYQPAITGPAYSLNIYRSQLTAYQEFTFKNKYETIFSFEGNHYNDNVLDGLLTSRIGLLYKLKKRALLSPYIEMAGLLGNTNYASGFPYWTAKEQFYGGAGVKYAYNHPGNKIIINLDAAFFKDTLFGSFFRYTGQVNYPIFKYLHLNTNAEFFTLKNFYSNNFNLGIKYYFRNK